MRTKSVFVRIKLPEDAPDETHDGEAGDSGTGAGNQLSDGQFLAYASVFGNVDSYGEVVDPGAFTNTLADWEAKSGPIPLYWAHQMADPTMNIGHVLDAKQDDVGLLVKGELDIARNANAAYAYELLKDKRVDQMSFAYDVIGADEQSDAIHLTELKLHEVSVVPIGANQETEVLTVKVAPTDQKSGRTLSAKNETAIKEAVSKLQGVLDSLSSEEPKARADQQTSTVSAADIIATLEGLTK